MVDLQNFLQNVGSALTGSNNSELSSGLMRAMCNAVDAEAVLHDAKDNVIALTPNFPAELLSSSEEGEQSIFKGANSNYVSCVVKLPVGDASLVLIGNKTKKFTAENVLTGEVCAASLAVLRQQTKIDDMKKEKAKLDLAIAVLNSLSFTEIDVIAEVLAQLINGEGLVVASKIADKNGYARSVTVNALRKLESAGVVTTRSLGVKGTFIRVTNKYICQEIKKFKRQKTS